MKIIIIKDRKYRMIVDRLRELENRLTAIRSVMGKQAGGDHPAAGDQKKVNDTVKVPDPDEVYIDAETVCELLCICGRTLLRMCKRHGLKHIRVSHRYYYRLSEVEMLFMQRSIAFTPEVRERLEQEIHRLKEKRNGKNGFNL